VSLVVVVFVVVLAFAIGGYVLDQRRRSAIAAHAAEREWTHLEEDSSLVGHFPGPPFDQGDDRRVTTVVRGRYDGRDLLAFDHTYETTSGFGSDRRTTWHKHSIVSLSLGAEFPSLSVAPEGLLSRMFNGFFGSDLTVGDAVFDDAFRISATDPAYAADVLQPEVRAVLLQHRDLTWRIEGDTLLAVRDGHHVAEEIEPTLLAVQAVIQAIPDRVWARVRGDG
jgi:hypothetical protein